MAKNIEEIKAALAAYGITGVKDVYYNPSYEQLFKDEMNPALTGYDNGVLTELNAVNVMTGIYTGRSPKDKYIVMDKNSKDTVWWTTEGYKNDNHPMSEEVWAKVKDLAKKRLAEMEAKKAAEAEAAAEAAAEEAPAAEAEAPAEA